MMAFGLITFFIGYAMFYTAFANFRNGFKGPKLTHSLGIDTVIAPPSERVPAGQTSPERRGGSGTF